MRAPGTLVRQPSERLLVRTCQQRVGLVEIEHRDVHRAQGWNDVQRQLRILDAMNWQRLAELSTECRSRCSAICSTSALGAGAPRWITVQSDLSGCRGRKPIVFHPGSRTARSDRAHRHQMAEDNANHGPGNGPTIRFE